MREVKANYKRDTHRVPNVLGGRRYNRTCFTRHKGQIQLTGSKI